MDKYYVDKTLTNVAVGRKRATFLAERVLPVVNHEDPTGKYWVLDRNDASLITQNTERAPGSSPHSLYTEPPETEDFTVKDHSLQDAMPDEYNPRATNALAKEGNKVEKLVDALDLVKEVNMLTRLAADVTNVTAPTTKFDNYTSSPADPIDYILGLFAQIEDAVGASPNFAAFDVKVARAIINHPSVKERAMPTMGPDRYNSGIGTMENLIALLLGLDEVMIANGSIRNIARKKETKNLQRTWGKNMLLGYKEAPTIDGYAGLGLTIKWDPPAEEGEDVIQGKLVERERLDNFRKSWGFAVHDYYAQVITNPKAGLWIPNVLT